MGCPLHLDKDEYDKERDRRSKACNRNGITPANVTATVESKKKSESCCNKTERSKEVDSSEFLPPVRVFDRRKV
jgi:hypothetical protein